ncbi:hypothetical protein NOC27_3165 [Nitrosococcus oceani AFC27]|nr:hypothetical protein NOC27_3165 [Nitrosococcus oceani AFC27]
MGVLGWPRLSAQGPRLGITLHAHHFPSYRKIKSIIFSENISFCRALTQCAIN